MNWYNSQRLKANSVNEKDAWEKRHHCSTKPTPEQRNQVLESTYGATFEVMAGNSQARRQQWLLDTLNDPSVLLNGAPEVSPNEYSYRDRNPDREIGPDGNFSSRKYVPRVYHTGGGKLNRHKTSDFLSLPSSHSKKVVNLLEPRFSTQSLMDIGTSRGRIVQPCYDERLTFQFRARELNKELHPPMHFKSKNDVERISDVLEKETVNDSGAWVEYKRANWRCDTPSKWRGKNFRANTAPSDNKSQFLNGKRYPRSQAADEPAVISPTSTHMVKDTAMQMRARQPNREIGGNFNSITKRDGREAATSPNRSKFEFQVSENPRRSLRYNKSLTEVPSILDEL